MIEKSYRATIGDHSDALHRAALLDLGDGRAARWCRWPGSADRGRRAADGLTGASRPHRGGAAPGGKVMTPEAWADLEESVVGYRIFETRRARPIPSPRSARAGSGWARRLTRPRPSCASCRELWTNPIRGGATGDSRSCREVRRKVETRAAFHEIGSAFGRRQNPHREFLYWGVMRVWTDRLGGELRYSNRPKDP